MPRHVWSVLCGRALVDRQTGSVSLVDATVQLLVRGVLPRTDVATVSVALTLVSDWVREGEVSETAEVRYVVREPAGRILREGSSVGVDLTVDARAQTIVPIAELPLSGPGRYELTVELRASGGLGWTTCARVPLDVAETGAPAAIDHP